MNWCLDSCNAIIMMLLTDTRAPNGSKPTGRLRPLHLTKTSVYLEIGAVQAALVVLRLVRVVLLLLQSAEELDELVRLVGQAALAAVVVGVAVHQLCGDGGEGTGL